MTISPSTEQPGLCRVPQDAHHSEVFVLCVANKSFNRDYERVLQEVIVDHAVGHCDVVVISTGSKEGITLVELNIPDSI